MLKGFDPIIGEEPQVMILGSMPSVSSLEKQEYYGFAHNRFWKIMMKCYGVTLNTYDEKQQLIKDHHILLWDVIGSCERIGSLDSAIRNEQVNDIASIIKQYPSIQKIICNGKKSHTLFMKHFQDITKELDVCYLPSTSNANRSIAEEVLFQMWLDALPK